MKHHAARLKKIIDSVGFATRDMEPNERAEFLGDLRDEIELQITLSEDDDEPEDE